MKILDPFTAVFSEIHAYLYVFLCVVGVFANIAIVVVLLRPAMRRSPFNLFLICIAICDATLMATYLLYKHSLIFVSLRVLNKSSLATDDAASKR
ncbi:hypothetical protein ANCDUO_14439 [Ancylostoma duodenale]|uniref:G-protein coupled receptors family 1 profile domain-containing protein n=1 Tax=Ancylostoma duodenale TaxID=51022 RepID=A0A0C2G3F7_9BILA|nr:hypothetical protein ANCDUO_14439 [Ancylostoma duodenale]